MKKLSLLYLFMFIFSFTQAQPVFSELKTIHSPGGTPQCIIYEDMDGDTKKDIIWAELWGDAIKWSKDTTGTGDFGTPKIISETVNGPTEIRAVDMDDDTDLDILVAISNDNEIAWFENTDGLGTFSSKNTISTAVHYPSAVFAVDLDDDTDLDVISAQRNDPEIAWYENNGSLSFTRHVILEEYSGLEIYACDLDNDDDIDIISSYHGGMSWLENDGSLNFTLHEIEDNDYEYPSIDVGYVNDDAYLDIVASAETSQPDLDDYLLYYENDGNGNFSKETYKAHLLVDIRTVTIADVDGDGDNDIAGGLYDYKNNMRKEVFWYENKDDQNGRTFFTHRNIVNTFTEIPESIVAADIDKDSDLDLLLAAGDIIWFENNPPVEITASPNDSTACPGQNNIKLSCDAKFANSYQWQVDEGSGFSDMHDIYGKYDKTNEAELYIYDTSTDITGFMYRCIAANDANADTSDFAVVTVEDNEPPVPDTENLPTESGECSVSLLAPSATDNCSFQTINGTTTDPTEYFDKGNYTVTWIYDDGSGNITEQTQTAIVTGDETNPVITSSHDDKTLEANENCQTSLPDYTGDVSATDNCDDSPTVTQNPVPGSIISGTTNLITLTASDDDGNTDEVSFNVEVVDVTDPQITSTHTTQTIETDENCEGTLPDYTSDVTSTDNCDDELAITQSPVADTKIAENTQITLTVTDDSGNSDEVSFNVEIEDNIQPVITSTHADKTENADVECELSLPDYTDEIEATDNCDDELEITQSPAAGTTIEGTTNEVTITVSDENDNSTEVSFNVEVIDNIAPEISLPLNDKTIYANENCQVELPDYTGDIQALDNCDNELTINQSPAPGTLLSDFMTEITITVTDDTGNQSQASFNVVKKDNTAPEFTSNHPDHSLVPDENCQAILPDYTDEIKATDNCDDELEITQSPAAGTIIEGATNEVTITVSDYNDNSNKISFNVKVIDSIAPEISSPLNDKTIYANENCQVELPDYTKDVTISDNCDTEIDINQSPAAGTQISESTIVTLSATDDEENTSEVTFNVNIQDDENPVISCIQNQDIELNADETSYVVSGTEFDPLTVKDNCGIESITNDYNNQSTLADASFNTGTTTVTWTVEDNTGNQAQCSVDITINTSTEIREYQHQDISIYPNPAKNKLTINGNKHSLTKIILKDLTGKTLIQAHPDKKTSVIHLNKIKSGVYIIEIQTKNNSYKSKIIKN